MLQGIHFDWLDSKYVALRSMHDDEEVSEDEYICILSTFVFLCRLQVGIIKRVSLRICFHLRFPIHRPKSCT